MKLIFKPKLNFSLMKKETGYNNMKLTSKEVDELVKNSCADSTYSLLIDNGFFELAEYVKINNINKGKLFNELMIKSLKRSQRVVRNAFYSNQF
jgi:hypothetical protein